MERKSKDKYYLDIAMQVASRSTCLKRKYGCVIVNNDEIIATGYNGSPRGETNCCDVYEECPRKNVPHNSGDYSDCISVHAEQNAMLSASRKEMIGATMYLYGEEYDDLYCVEPQWSEIKNPQPCPICKRMINNSGISKIINDGFVFDIANGGIYHVRNRDSIL